MLLGRCWAVHSAQRWMPCTWTPPRSLHPAAVHHPGRRPVLVAPLASRLRQAALPRRVGRRRPRRWSPGHHLLLAQPQGAGLGRHQHQGPLQERSWSQEVGTKAWQTHWQALSCPRAPTMAVESTDVSTLRVRGARMCSCIIGTSETGKSSVVGGSGPRSAVRRSGLTTTVRRTAPCHLHVGGVCCTVVQ